MSKKEIILPRINVNSRIKTDRNALLIAIAKETDRKKANVIRIILEGLTEKKIRSFFS